jgi:hypothetical protein
MRTNEIAREIAACAVVVASLVAFLASPFVAWLLIDGLQRMATNYPP